MVESFTSRRSPHIVLTAEGRPVEPVIESMQAHVVMHLGLVFIWGECGKVIVKATVLDEHNNIAAEDTNPRMDEMVAAFTGLVST